MVYLVSMTSLRSCVQFKGISCTLVIRRLQPGIVLVVFQGHDTGEFGDAPFRELTADVQQHTPINLFIDGRGTLAASLDVSSNWAQWMCENRERIAWLDILVGSRFLQLTAEFVRRFSQFEDRMRIYTDPEAFETELKLLVRAARSKSSSF